MKQITQSKTKIFKIFFLFFVITQLSFSQNKDLINHEHGELIIEWLKKNKNNYNLSNNDISEIKVEDSYYSKKTQITHIYINQYYQGIKIHNALTNIAIRNNAVFNVSNGFISQINFKANTTAPKINAETAIFLAANALELSDSKGIKLLSSTKNNFIFSKGNLSKKDIPVNLIYLKINENTLKLAWELSIKTLNKNHSYTLKIDATSGKVIDVRDMILSCDYEQIHKNNSSKKIKPLLKQRKRSSIMGSQYNVFPLPVESPNHGVTELVLNPSTTNASPYGWHDTDGVDGPEHTITRGNNVHAFKINFGSSDEISPDGGTDLNFNFQYSQSDNLSDDLDFIVTNLFYANNKIHDILYEYGFDEASGNLQQNNYSQGGLGEDQLLAITDGNFAKGASVALTEDGSMPDMYLNPWFSRKSTITINNGSLTGTYDVAPANMGTDMIINVFDSDIILIRDGNQGASTDEHDGCDPLNNSSEIQDKVVLMRESDFCEFDRKVSDVSMYGPKAIIVVNNIPGPPIVKDPTTIDGFFLTTPTFMISQTDGNAMIDAINNGETINVKIPQDNFYEPALDNLVLAHEYTHLLSSRLAGGPSNISCLIGQEQMGEGWSDWFGLMLTMTENDLPETKRGIGTYLLNQETDGQGIRPFPYSTDPSINATTYASTNDESAFSVPHGIGAIWGQILWNLTWKYIEKYGFDNNIYNGDGGNNKVMQLVIDGLKLQSCEPGFVDGRDAILAADRALTNGEDQCLIWEVFAAKGVGLNASQGASNSRLDQVEDFTLPPDSDPTLSNCTTLSTDKKRFISDYKIFPNPTNNNISIKPSKRLGQVIFTLTDINGKIVFNKNEQLNAKVNIDMNNLQAGIYFLKIKGKTINSNDKVIKY